MPYGFPSYGQRTLEVVRRQPAVLVRFYCPHCNALGEVGTDCTSAVALHLDCPKCKRGLRVEVPR